MMVWVVTLQITSCASGTPLGGAIVNDGFQNFFADGNGQFIAIVDDVYTGYIVAISKSGYVTRNFALSNTQNGSIQHVCLNTAPPQPPNQGGGGISCFIVSAATGSAQSEEVLALRALRDKIMGMSTLAGGLINAIYDEYWRFSPAIAARVDDDKLLRQGVLWAVVRPLVAWYKLAGALAFEKPDSAAVKDALKAMKDACPIWLKPASIASIVSSLRLGEEVPASAPQQLKDLAPKVADAVKLPLVSWAIFEPLEKAWQTAARRLDPQAEVAAWLASAPLEQQPLPEANQWQREMAALAQILSFDEAQRVVLGSRLKEAWPQTESVLTSTGLLGGPVPVEKAIRPDSSSGGGCGCQS